MTRFGYVMVMYFVSVGIGVAALIPTPTKLIWNATASALIGFYTIEPAERIEAPELVAIMPPDPLAAFMVERGYIGRGVPLLKRPACRGSGCAACAPRSRSMASIWAMRSTATGSVANCPSGRAAGSSPRASFS